MELSAIFAIYPAQHITIPYLYNSQFTERTYLSSVHAIMYQCCLIFELYPVTVTVTHISLDSILATTVILHVSEIGKPTAWKRPV